MKTFLKIVASVAFILFCFRALPVLAANPPPDPNASLPIDVTTTIPGLDASTIRTQGPVALVGGFYTFAFGIAGFLAFVMIVYGGARYAFSAGNHAAQSDAKDAILQALLGLGLLFGAYLILRIINPDLTTLRLPTLQSYNLPINTTTGPTTEAVCSGTIYGHCPVGQNCVAGDGGQYSCQALVSSCAAAALLPSLDPDAQAFENGATVSFHAGDSNVQQNLTKLSAEYAKLHLALPAGVTASVTSAYRPLGYQSHLWNICDRYKKLGGSGAPSNVQFTNTDTGCSALESQIASEIQKHALNAGCIVSSPSGCAPHVKGTGIDISIQGMPLSSINQFLASHGIDLRWQGLTDDPNHFNLQNPPYTGCAAGVGAG